MLQASQGYLKQTKCLYTFVYYLYMWVHRDIIEQTTYGIPFWFSTVGPGDVTQVIGLVSKSVYLLVHRFICLFFVCF